MKDNKNAKKKVHLKKDNVEVDALKMQLARALADYDNLQKRVDREQLEIKNRVRSQFLAQLLPAIDLLYDVQKHFNDPGLALCISQFEEAILDQRIAKIAPNEGDDFDENFHDAVDTISDNEKKNKIAEVVKNGWMFVAGSVIQPAKVKVYK